MKEESNPILYRSRGFLIFFVIAFTLRIISYFTLFVKSLALTQVFKVGIRIGLTIVFYFFILHLKDKYKRYKFSYENMMPMFLYCGYLALGLASVTWSTKPSYSLLQWVMVSETLVFSWLFCQLFAFYRALSDNHMSFPYVFGRATLVVCVGFFIGLYYDPDTFYRLTHGGTVPRAGGYIINPNELGLLNALGALMGYMEILRDEKKFWNFVVVAVNVILLLLTQSRSSLGSFLLITAITILLSRNLKLIAFTIGAGVLIMPILVNTIILKQGNIEEVMSMTGRLPFWSDMLTDGFPQQPFFGFGFMRIANTDYFYSIHAYAAKMAHNAFVQILMNLGIAGLFVCGLQMIASFYVVTRAENILDKYLVLLMLIPVIINSIMEFGIFGECNYGIQFYEYAFLFFTVKCVQRNENYINYFSKPNVNK